MVGCRLLFCASLLTLGDEYALYPVRRQSQPKAPAPQSQKNLPEQKKEESDIRGELLLEWRGQACTDLSCLMNST